jgi:hypothetical protein
LYVLLLVLRYYLLSLVAHRFGRHRFKSWAPSTCLSNASKHVTFASNQCSAKPLKPVVETPPIGRLSRLPRQSDNHPRIVHPYLPHAHSNRLQAIIHKGLLSSRGNTHRHSSASRLAAQARTKHDAYREFKSPRWARILL